MAVAPSPLGEHLPSWLFTPHVFELSLAQWLGLVLLGSAAVLAGALGQRLLVWLSRVTTRSDSAPEGGVLAALPGPARLLCALLVFYLFVPLLALPTGARAVVDVLVRTLLIVAATWLVLRLIGVAFAALEAYLARRVADANRLRTLQTQLALPRAILRVAVVVVGIALELLQFDVVRSVGVSLLASAGIAGVIIGLATQRAAANLLAGIQLALSQPIRIGDVVALENEWGWVEEIGLTNVVVKLWDLRRLVLPVSYFLEKPFQNWSRGTGDLLGTVVLRADWSIDIDAVRAEVARILDETDLWDRRTQAVQVTDLAVGSVELRVLVGARDGLRLWDLRCLVREKLLAWLKAQQGARS
jgi:small-conductance mechanosensitive channel